MTPLDPIAAKTRAIGEPPSNGRRLRAHRATVVRPGSLRAGGAWPKPDFGASVDLCGTPCLDFVGRCKALRQSVGGRMESPKLYDVLIPIELHAGLGFTGQSLREGSYNNEKSLQVWGWSATLHETGNQQYLIVRTNCPEPEARAATAKKS